MVVGLAVLLLLAGFAVLTWAVRTQARAGEKRSELGLPKGQLVYLDEGLKSEVLTSEAWGLKGKPDLLLKQGKQVIPVDQKPGRSRAKPYLGQVMQLACYCALVEERYGVRPTHGLIRYEGDGVDVEVPYTPELEVRLKQTLELMREARRARTFTGATGLRTSAGRVGSGGCAGRVWRGEIRGYLQPFFIGG